MKNHKNNKGFTLIEVLVAGVILFASIAVVTNIYRGSFIASQKANNHVYISGVLPSILAVIKRDIRAQGNNSQTELNGKNKAFEVDYQWSATLAKFKAAPERFDVDSGNIEQQNKKYKLWLVELDIQRNGIHRNYTFNELSWNGE
jgi:type II secretory pathway component PulJ